MVKEFLSQKGVRFTEKDVSQDSTAAQDAYRVSGQMGVPVITIDQEVVVGFDRPKLERALQAAPASARRPFGLRIADASRITRERGSLPLFGAYVDRVAPGSPAEHSGLAAGDIVVEVNLRTVGSAHDLEKVLESAPPGSRLAFVFLRGNQRLRAEAVM